MERFDFLKNWGRVNLFYLLPASLLVVFWAFAQPSTGKISLSEIWISLLFYSNVFSLAVIGLRGWALKRKDGAYSSIFIIPLSLSSGAVFYLFPFAFLTALTLVETQGEQLLKLSQSPGLLESAPFLALCFFFAFPILWVCTLILAWFACWIWRAGRLFFQTLRQERLKNLRVSHAKDPLLALWAAVNLFYVFPASIALPIWIFYGSEDPDALFVLLISWFLLVVVGNVSAGIAVMIRWYFLKKRGYSDFKIIVLSPKLANCLYIMPLVALTSFEAAGAAWGRTFLQMSFDVFLTELPWYLGFFLLDLVCFWCLATLFSWCTRALATIFWQPDPKLALHKVKMKKMSREMPDFLIQLPASLTGNLLDHTEIHAPKTPETVKNLAAENRPAAGPLILYYALFPDCLKQFAFSGARAVGYYALPLGIAWGIGAVFLLGEGNWRDFFQLSLWATVIAFLLGFVLQAYLFLLGLVAKGLLFAVTGRHFYLRENIFFNFIQNILRYILPAPILVAWLATIPGFFTEKPIEPRSAFWGAFAVMVGALLLSLFFQGVCKLLRMIFSYYFGRYFKHYAQNRALRQAEKQALKKTYYKWQSGKYHYPRRKAVMEPEKDANQPVRVRKITKIQTSDGKIIAIRSFGKHKGKP